MYFYTKDSKIRIAFKDIDCYKCVHTYEFDCLSYYQVFRYKYDQKYSGKSKLNLFLKWLHNENITCEAYHSYTLCNYASIPCIIPKGSLYLIDKYKKEYCSTSIIIKNPKYYLECRKKEMENLKKIFYDILKNHYVIVNNYKRYTDIPISHKLFDVILKFIKKRLEKLKIEFNNFKTN